MRSERPHVAAKQPRGTPEIRPRGFRGRHRCKACLRASADQMHPCSVRGARGSAPPSDSRERAVRCRMISMPWLHLQMLRGTFDPKLFVAGMPPFDDLLKGIVALASV